MDKGEATTYCVLGPLLATLAGERVTLGGKRQRMVLAMLIANANRPLGQEVLVDAVWNGSAPATGVRTLHTYVSNLRRVLDGAIEREGEGYVLQVESDVIDALRFDGCVAEGRALLSDQPSEAARVLRTGLGMWTGPAYGDLGPEPALAAEANRLTAQRMEALELRFEADLAVGRHVEIVPELEAMLREEPYREHLASMLMLALYRSGRPVDALQVYRSVRTNLVEELGIEPGQALQELELRIIERDATLAVDAGPPSPQKWGARGYELHEETAASEFGKRYRGFQGTMAREVSVLVVEGADVDSPGFIRRFDAEMQTVTTFEHPNLAPVLDYWREAGGAYVITPHYRGGNLAEALLDRPLDLGTAVRIADRLASVLDLLHRQGYAHGAVAAGAVLLDEERNPYLTDLGLRGAVRSSSEPSPAEDIEQLAGLVMEMLGGEETSHREIRHAISRAQHPEPSNRFASVEDLSRALRQSTGLDIQPFQVEPPSDVERRNPYKGLAAFQESEAAEFHGRDDLVEELVASLQASRLVAVVGPSGSGKSSVVRAGLLPRLRAGALPGSEDWLITTLFPGTHPFEALAESLRRVATAQPGDLWPVLTGNDRGLLDAVDLLVPHREVCVLVVIDQFEELFSPAVPAADRDRFLGALTTAVQAEERVAIVATLRADFFDHPLSHPGFGSVFRDHVVAVGPPTVDGLTRAVSQPAIRAGVSLEPGLASRIVDDGRGQPAAALPLLQFALTELFERRDGDVLTLAGYEAIGGVGGALARRAEEAYGGLTPVRRKLAQQLFLRLVAVDEVADDTRRRVNLSELRGLHAEPGAMDDLINQFGALRFLSFDHDPASRAPTVELAHEALLHRWQRMAGWIDERREDLLIHRRLQITVSDWLESGEDASFLLRGNRLDQACSWLERTDIVASDDERRLLEVSGRVERGEQESQAALERTAHRRRQAVLVVVAISAVVAGVVGAFAFWQRGVAVDSADVARSRELALASLTIADDDPELGILLAAEALKVGDRAGDEPSPQALGALWSAYVDHRVEAAVARVGNGGVAYHPDGTMLAVDSSPEGDGMITLRDALSGDELAVMPSRREVSGGVVESMEFSPDGSLLYVGRHPSDSLPTAVLEVFDVADRALVAQVPLAGTIMAQLSVATSGLVSATSISDDEPLVVELVDFDQASNDVTTRRLGTDGLLASALYGVNGSFLSNGDELVVAVAQDGNRLVTVDAQTGAVVADVPIELSPFVVTAAPQGRRVAVGDSDGGRLAVLDLATGEPVFRPVAHQDPQAISWSPDGSQLAVSGNESDVTVIDAETGDTVLILSGHTASIYSTNFHPDGQSLASVSVQGELRLWDITSAGPAGLGGGFGDLARLQVSEEGFVAGNVDGVMHAIDATGGEVIFRHDGFDPLLGQSAKLAGAAGLIAGAGQASTAIVNDALTGQTIGQLPPCTEVSGISPDGRWVALNYVGPGSNDLSMCTAGPKTGLFDRQSEELVIDLTETTAPWAAISGADTFSGKRYAALTAFIAQGNSTEVQIYSVEPTRLLGTLQTGDTDTETFLVPEFRSDARYLAIGTNGPSVVVVDIAVLEDERPIEEAVTFNREVHTGNAAQAYVTPDGIVATAAFDGFYRFWDLETGELRFEIEVTDLRGNSSHAFSHDYRTYYYEDGNGVLRAMPTDVDELIELATSSITRVLTDDECRRYLHTDGCEKT